MSHRSSNDDLPTRSTTNTQTFLETCVLEADPKALKEHLVNNHVQQSDLDRCLLRGLQIVHQKERELSHVAPALKILLQSGAKWNSDVLLDDRKTPYHLICQPSGDHHELLDLMLLSSGKALIDKEDRSNRTALVYAIRKANINCVRSLLKNGANPNHRGNSTNWRQVNHSPLIQAMVKNGFDSEHSAITKVEIFDLLLASGAHVNEPCDKGTPPPVICALYYVNVKCMIKLIQRGARLGRTPYGRNYVWAQIVKTGNVEALKSVIKHGIDKDSTDIYCRSMLYLVIESGDVEAVRYLLDLGATLPTNQLEAKSGTNRIDLDRDHEQVIQDLCVAAISTCNLNIIQMVEKHGAQGFHYFNIIRDSMCSPDVTEYLLNKYTYPLNYEYTIKDASTGHYNYWTILMEACHTNKIDVAKMLLDHGADPNKRMCKEKCFGVINIAIQRCNVKMVAHLIRSGLDVNARSYHAVHGYVLPFEAAVLDDNLYAAKMILLSGGSCGVYSLNNNHKLKANTNPNLKNFTRKWNVGSNKVNPLEQQCRRVILKDLSPQAHKKIQKLPLPHCIIKYLSIPELDDIVNLTIHWKVEIVP